MYERELVTESCIHTVLHVQYIHESYLVHIKIKVLERRL